MPPQDRPARCAGRVQALRGALRARPRNRPGQALRQVGGPASPRFVPCDDCELVGQNGELPSPNTAVLGRAVNKDQGWPLTDRSKAILSPSASTNSTIERTRVRARVLLPTEPSPRLALAAKPENTSMPGVTSMRAHLGRSAHTVLNCGTTTRSGSSTPGSGRRPQSAASTGAVALDQARHDRGARRPDRRLLR